MNTRIITLFFRREAGCFRLNVIRASRLNDMKVTKNLTFFFILFHPQRTRTFILNKQIQTVIQSAFQDRVKQSFRGREERALGEGA